jgi:hypothetical protein
MGKEAARKTYDDAPCLAEELIEKSRGERTSQKE